MAEWVGCKQSFDGFQKETQEALRHTVFLTETLSRKLDYGRMAEWLGKGLQNPPPRFNSGCDLKLKRWWAGKTTIRECKSHRDLRKIKNIINRASGGIGIHAGLKIL